MVVYDIGDYTCIFVVLSGKEYLAAVNNRVAIGKSVVMARQNYPFPYQIGIIKLIASFYIITYIVSNDYFIGIA